MTNNNQITNGGIAQLSGLEVLVGDIAYGDEILSLGNPFIISNIDSAEDTATTEADAQLSAVQTTYTAGFTSNIWYKYHTSGSPYTNIAAPDTSGNYARFRGHKDGGATSYGGIYQQLSELIVGEEYFIDIVVPSATTVGTITIKRYYPSNESVAESSDSISFTMPYATNNLTASFIANSSNDIILVDYTTGSTSAVEQYIYSMSIKSKQEYLIPVYAEDRWGNAHKVLRRNAGNPNLNT